MFFESGSRSKPASQGQTGVVLFCNCQFFMSKQETDGFKPYFIHKQILGKRMAETVWMPGNPGVLGQLSISSG